MTADPTPCPHGYTELDGECVSLCAVMPMTADPTRRLVALERREHDRRAG
jgi:hypothetical protein